MFDGTLALSGLILCCVVAGTAGFTLGEEAAMMPGRSAAPKSASAKQVRVCLGVCVGVGASVLLLTPCWVGCLQVTDFGLSNSFSPGEKLKTACGSVSYSCPEILLGEPYDGPLADMWSLGTLHATCIRSHRHHCTGRCNRHTNTLMHVHVYARTHIPFLPPPLPLPPLPPLCTCRGDFVHDADGRAAFPRTR